MFHDVGYVGVNGREFMLILGGILVILGLIVCVRSPARQAMPGAVGCRDVTSKMAHRERQIDRASYVRLSPVPPEDDKSVFEYEGA